MELLTGALSCLKCHWPNLKNAGLFRRNLFLNSLKTPTNVKTVLFQAILFGISIQFSSIWLIDRTLSGATPLTQSGLGSDGNEGVPRIPQNSSVTGTSDCFVSYPLQRSSWCILQPPPTQLTGPQSTRLEESYTPTDKQSAYSIAPSLLKEVLKRVDML